MCIYFWDTEFSFPCYLPVWLLSLYWYFIIRMFSQCSFIEHLIWISHGISFLFFFFFFVFFVFLGPHAQHKKVSTGQGLNLSCSHLPTPQPLRCWIQAASVTYTTAPGNIGSLTHWARDGAHNLMVPSWATMGIPFLMLQF